jgi:hypothetical protein
MTLRVSNKGGEDTFLVRNSFLAMSAAQRLALPAGGWDETTPLCRNQLQATQTAQKRGAYPKSDMFCQVAGKANVREDRADGPSQSEDSTEEVNCQSSGLSSRENKKELASLCTQYVLL